MKTQFYPSDFQEYYYHHNMDPHIKAANGFNAKLAEIKKAFEKEFEARNWWSKISFRKEVEKNYLAELKSTAAVVYTSNQEIWDAVKASPGDTHRAYLIQIEPIEKVMTMDEVSKVEILGMNVDQVRQLKEFYEFRTGELPRRIEEIKPKEECKHAVFVSDDQGRFGQIVSWPPTCAKCGARLRARWEVVE